MPRFLRRRDFALNICEIKFAEKEFVTDKAYAAELESKRNVFKHATGTRKSLFLTMITTFGVRPNEYSAQMIEAEVSMDSLFDYGP